MGGEVHFEGKHGPNPARYEAIKQVRAESDCHCRCWDSLLHLYEAREDIECGSRSFCIGLALSGELAPGHGGLGLWCGHFQ